VRGDHNKIKIGKFTNIQDRAVVNISVENNEGLSSEVVIGSYVTIGHGALLNSCVVENHVLIGQVTMYN
jgi:carbonic anhydrase/acetyltransferase-like protein (isoleucine patch superfamily)